MKNKKIKELLERGVIEIIDQKVLEKKLLSGKKLRVKLGIDPTGPKIHLGRAIIIRKLRDFQNLGHQVILIIGDATAMIGDSSDKLSKRPMLTRGQVKENMKDYKKQLGKILDLKKTEFLYNSAWLKKINFIEVGELAESFSLQQMSARRNFKERINKGEEVSMREVLYPLMQGYDSVAVKADIELGGFDQLFNLKAGRIIQKHFGQPEQDILMVEMLEGTDGRKMSTSWGNVINILDEPNDMFGKVMSIKDELITKYFLLCTDISGKEIKKIKTDLKKGANPRDIKMRLAREIVTMYHSEKEAEKAKTDFVNQFSKKKLPEKIEEFKFSGGDWKLYDVLVDCGLTDSKNEAKRLIEQNAVKVDGAVISDREAIMGLKTGMIIQAGKRRFGKIRVVK